MTTFQIPYNGSVRLSASSAAGASLALQQDIHVWTDNERMAWFLMLLRRCEDKEEFFPRGKWATIQEIENQLNREADALLAELEKRK